MLSFFACTIGVQLIQDGSTMEILYKHYRNTIAILSMDGRYMIKWEEKGLNMLMPLAVGFVFLKKYNDIIKSFKT